VTAAGSSYKGFRFPPEIISYCVWQYHRFPLSFREVEELMLVRGVIVSYETIRQWCAKFGPEYGTVIPEGTGCVTRVSLEGLRFRRPGSVSRCWPRLRSHSNQRGWPQRWHGYVRPRRAHRPVGWPGRCVAPSIRPCWRRWYPTTGARGWCSRRNRSGDKSRHPRAQTTPVEGSPHGPVGRRTGEPRRCRVVRGREDLPRETIRDLSTTPHQSMASTNQLPACSAWLQSAPPRLDRQARTASAALECGSAAAGRSKRVVPHCFPGGPLAP